MKVIKPVEMTPSKLISTTATNSNPNWSNSTNYVTGNKVTYNYRTYEALRNNSNKQPDTSPDDWLDVGPSNVWAMFDEQISTQTVAGSSTLTVVIRPQTAITTLALLNTVATSATVTVKDAPGGTTVYTRTLDFDDTIIANWFDYFFEDYNLRNEVIFKEIPPYFNCEVQIYVNLSSNPKVGQVVMGKIAEIGQTQYGLNFGIRDYSVKETDEFGVTTFVPRKYSKRMEPEVMIENSKINYVSKLLSELRATPTVWLAVDNDNRYSTTTVYGFLKDWNVQVVYPENSLLQLQIEGLI